MTCCVNKFINFSPLWCYQYFVFHSIIYVSLFLFHFTDASSQIHTHSSHRLTGLILFSSASYHITSLSSAFRVACMIGDTAHVLPPEGLTKGHGSHPEGRLIKPHNQCFNQCYQRYADIEPPFSSLD